MSKVHNTAILSALHLQSADAAPTHVHLLPKGRIDTADQRGPYFAENLDEIVRASFDGLEDKRLVLDINHSTDLAAPKGGEAPAVGWITSLEAREDGIWGAVEWTDRGRELVQSKAYRGISPAILFDKATKKVLGVLRASLVNFPNLRGLTALNAEESGMSLMERLAEILGLQPTATEDEIVAAVKKANTKDEAPPALQSAMTQIGTALGVDGSNVAAVVAGVQALQAAQATNVTQAARIAALETAQKRTAAENFMAGQLAAKRGIPADKREGLIALHMTDPAQAEAVAKLYPDLGTTAAAGDPPAKDAVVALNAEQIAVADQLGIAHDVYLAAVQADSKKG